MSNVVQKTSEKKKRGKRRRERGRRRGLQVGLVSRECGYMRGFVSKGKRSWRKSSSASRSDGR